MNEDRGGAAGPPPDDPRVRFAAERTLLAWLRTALALMGFGFVVARFGLFLGEIAALGRREVDPSSQGWSLAIGTGLIALGIVVSLVAACEHFRFVRRSRRIEAYVPRTAMLAVAVTLILALLGAAMAVYLVWMNA